MKRRVTAVWRNRCSCLSRMSIFRYNLYFSINKTFTKVSDPNLVTDEDYEEFITVRGRGWVCEIDNQIMCFAITDLKENIIWALFLDPTFEKKSIGQKLHKIMLDWYFTKTHDKIWLGTAFNTRAEQFYRKAGWTEVGTHKQENNLILTTIKPNMAILGY